MAAVAIFLSIHWFCFPFFTIFVFFPIICVVFILYSIPFLRHIIEKKMTKTEFYSLAEFWTWQSGSGGREKLQNILSELFATAQQKHFIYKNRAKTELLIENIYWRFWGINTASFTGTSVTVRRGGWRKVKTNSDWMNKTFKASKWGLCFDYFLSFCEEERVSQHSVFSRINGVFLLRSLLLICRNQVLVKYPFSF